MGGNACKSQQSVAPQLGICWTTKLPRRTDALPSRVRRFSQTGDAIVTLRGPVLAATGARGGGVDAAAELRIACTVGTSQSGSAALPLRSHQLIRPADADGS